VAGRGQSVADRLCTEVCWGRIETGLRIELLNKISIVIDHPIFGRGEDVRTIELIDYKLAQSRGLSGRRGGIDRNR
jgi:hypothetical protein